MSYPEHEKMAALRPQIDAVTEFLEGLRGRGKMVVDTEDRDADYARVEDWGRIPVAAFAWPSIEDLLAEHFGIDRQRIAEEKTAMLEALRSGS